MKILEEKTNIAFIAQDSLKSKLTKLFNLVNTRLSNDRPWIKLSEEEESLSEEFMDDLFELESNVDFLLQKYS